MGGASDSLTRPATPHSDAPDADDFDANLYTACSYHSLLILTRRFDPQYKKMTSAILNILKTHVLGRASYSARVYLLDVLLVVLTSDYYYYY